MADAKQPLPIGHLEALLLSPCDRPLLICNGSCVVQVGPRGKDAGAEQEA